ncbi:MAG: DNA methyltransferase [Pirellulaceae bacterium]
MAIMQTLEVGSVDCVITDPPFSGFGFRPATYMYTMKPFVVQMARCVSGEKKRLAMSQSPERIEALSELLGSGTVVKIPDAFADARGTPASFVLCHPLETEGIEPELWKDLPPSTHPNHRDANKMAMLVKMMTKPGETVLDPFCGSGAIGIACVMLRRNFIGIELHADRAEEARMRLDILRSG